MSKGKRRAAEAAAEQATETTVSGDAQTETPVSPEAGATEEAPKAAKPEKAPKALPTEEAEVARLNAKYAGAKVLAVTEWGKRGATRVKVGCSHVAEDGTTCGAAREIAVQDAFQVRRCLTHQKTVGRKGRSAKRAAVVAGLKAEVEALKAALAEANAAAGVEVEGAVAE